MDVTVLIYAIIDDYAGTYDGLTYDAGDQVHVIFDTVTLDLSVDLYDSAASLKGSPSSGPNLAAFRSYELLTIPPFYQFCDGTTLRYINDKPNIWPYAELLSNANHYLCIVEAPVCDLQISSVIEITSTSTSSATDGEITVSATSSAGGIKYGLTDFDYSTGGQSSGTFSGLLTGVYTVYAKDANGCYDTVSVYVPVISEYGVYYRAEFEDICNYSDHKIDILKRNYSGAVTEICSASTPIRITYSGFSEGKYSPLVGSSAVIGLMSETSQQFSEIFLSDEREYQVRYYRDGELRWLGFVIPSMYEEPYIATPYPVYITATDGIGDLKNIKFLDSVEERYRGSVSQIFVIAEALKKIDLDIDIHSGINLYEADMDQADTDDPLDQAYVDTDTYYGAEPEEVPMDCDAVLQAILKPYGARLYQSYGKWWIVRTSEMVGEFDYRVFDSDGVYLSNSSIDPRNDFSSGSDINRAVPRDKAGLLTIIPGYGKITITQDKGLRNNLIKSGEFEEDDLIPTGIGTGLFFRDWTIELNSAGLSYGFENVINGDSRGAFYMDFLYASDNDYSLLKSSLIPISSYPTDKLKFTFEYLARPSIEAHWVRFGFKIIATGGLAGTQYYTTNPLFNTSITSPWLTTDTLNEIYADKYGEWVKLEFSFPPAGNLETDIEIRFYLQANNRYDYSSVGSLPSSLPYGTKRTVGRTIGTEDHISYYTFIDTNEPDDSPNLVVAGDGAWKLEKTIRFENDSSILNSILIDNAKIEYLPGGGVPDEEEVFTFINSPAIKINYEEDVIHGDVADENNARNIYKGYLRLSDGTPTASWSRDAFTESKTLVQILLEDYLAQFSEANYRIQSPIFYDIDIAFLNTFEDQFDSGRQYVFASLDMDVKQNTANVEMIEIKPAVSLSNFSSAFSTAFGTQYD